VALRSALSTVGVEYRFAADRRPGPRRIDILLPVVVAHDKAGVQFLDRLGREVAGGHLISSQNAPCVTEFVSTVAEMSLAVPSVRTKF
jgi:hypothetical protein